MPTPISFTTTPGYDYGVELGQIERKRALAQALQQQSMQETPQQMAGGWVVPSSPLQGAAKLAQALAGKRSQAKADEQQMAMNARMGNDRAATLSAALRTAQGTPGQTIQPDPQEAQQSADQGTPQVGPVTQPGQAPNRAAAMQMLAGSRDPVLAQAGMSNMMNALAPKDQFAKVDPKDYTPASVAKFTQTGNYSDLVGTPKLHFADTGSGIQGVDPTTGAPVGTALPKGITPDASANLAFRAMEFGTLSANQKAHIEQEAQRIGISRQQLQEGRVQVVQDADGAVHLVNKITSQATPATTQGGDPLRVAKPLTEAQGKANLFGTRAEEADKIMRELETNISTAGLAAKRGAENIPILGGPLGAIGNAALSGNQQKVEQAQRNFVNAVLRLESGAAISQSEFDNAVKQYFPQPNDKPEAIEQKRANRATAISGLKQMSGSAQRRSADQLDPAIEAIIQKYAKG